MTDSDIDIETTDNEPSRLKKIIIIFGPCLLRVFGVQSIRGLVEAAIFVDYCKLLDDIVVESVEHNQDDAASGREAKKPMFRKAIWLQLPIFESANIILIFLSIAIKW